MTKSMGWTVRFHRSGYCWQLGHFARRSWWGPSRFAALFLTLEHPTHGNYIVDTGYSPAFFEATRYLPERVYRWLTPPRLDPARTPAQVLVQAGFNPNQFQGLILTHYHGDHIGGLASLSDIPILYRSQPLEKLMQLNRWERLHHGFLADLLPSDLRERGIPIVEEAWVEGEGDLLGFRVQDYWKDGSCYLVDLPGHAQGHMGLYIRGVDRTWFYIVDATWNVPAMLASKRVPYLAQRIQLDSKVYLETQERLRRLHQATSIEMVACHCQESLRHTKSSAQA